MDRTALFVDAGYILAAGSQLVLNDHTAKRSSCTVHAARLAHNLMMLVRSETTLPLLRTYWYDGSYEHRRTAEHRSLLDVPLVKLRLGKNTAHGQKGVDSLIFRDLTTLARERAICSAYLVAGDDDMREAVTMVQDLGVQVTLITVLPIPGSGFENTSKDLVDEVDAVETLELEWLAPFFTRAGAGPTDF